MVVSAAGSIIQLFIVSFSFARNIFRMYVLCEYATGMLPLTFMSLQLFLRERLNPLFYSGVGAGFARRIEQL